MLSNLVRWTDPCEIKKDLDPYLRTRSCPSKSFGRYISVHVLPWLLWSLWAIPLFILACLIGMMCQTQTEGIRFLTHLEFNRHDPDDNVRFAKMFHVSKVHEINWNQPYVKGFPFFVSTYCMAGVGVLSIAFGFTFVLVQIVSSLFLVCKEFKRMIHSIHNHYSSWQQMDKQTDV